MKKFNVFYTSEIIVMSDHGYTTWGRSPLLLQKTKNMKNNQLCVSTNAISYSNLHASLLSGINKNWQNYGSPFELNKHDNKTRTFLWYPLLSWHNGYAPTMWEYHINGNAQDYKSWFPTFKVLSPEAPGSYNYKLGTLINFGKGGNSIRYSCGWSVQEDEYTWSEGGQCSLLLKIIDSPHTDLKMNVLLAPYLGKEMTHQEVEVIVNGYTISKLIVSKKSEFVIPLSRNIIAKNDLIKVTFVIRSPMSPKDQGVGSDHRKLGIAIYNATIS